MFHEYGFLSAAFKAAVSCILSMSFSVNLFFPLIYLHLLSICHSFFSASKHHSLLHTVPIVLAAAKKQNRPL